MDEEDDVDDTDDVEVAEVDDDDENEDMNDEVSYILEWSNDSEFPLDNTFIFQLDDTLHIIAGLADNHDDQSIYWRVKAVDTFDLGVVLKHVVDRPEDAAPDSLACLGLDDVEA